MRRLLKRRKVELLNVLGTHETVHHVCNTMGSAPGAAVITTARVIHLSYVPGQENRSVQVPYRIDILKKGLLGARVDVTDNHGTSLHLHLLTDEDYAALQDMPVNASG